MEFAGSLGDLGTILPLALGMIVINGLAPSNVFLGIGLFYIFSGLYFRITSPVEPMKVISGYALAAGITVGQIQASCLWLFLILIILGTTGAISSIAKYINKPVVRGVQLATGLVLIVKGITLMVGISPLQEIHNLPEPNLIIQTLGPVPIGLIIGGVMGIITLLLIDNKHFPAAIVIVGGGVLLGIILGIPENRPALAFDFSLPSLLPYGLPKLDDLTFALLALVLPQIPMTVGNAIISNADLSAQYFPETGRRVTYRSLCVSMAIANLGSFFIGGIPMCQGAGGLASRYRFGARTAGSNLIIGGVFLLLVLFLGAQITSLIQLIPFSVLGVLLIFAGLQLALTVLDLQTRKEMAVPVIMVAIALSFNLAVGFMVGCLLDALLRWRKVSI